MSRVIDYAFKKKVLDSNLCERIRSAMWHDFCRRDYEENGVVRKSATKQHETLNDIHDSCLLSGTIREYNEALKINNAFYQRLKRLRARVSNMLNNGECTFLTLTFTDETLTSTSAKERRVLVSRYLKRFNALYVANIDFGKANHREHYHALINSADIDYSVWHEYGAIKGEKVRFVSGDSCVKLSKYVCKLANHAIKETTKRSALLYSRA